MIFPHDTEVEKTRSNVEPFIVPLAVPLIAGPSTMAMVMLLANQAPYDMPRWFVALLAALGHYHHRFSLCRFFK